jgi:UDP-N-acetylglucosamine 3-dehydrogenase
VDAVCICAPSTRHAEIALDAIATGKHVFVEKPIATTLQDGLRMAAAARVAGVKLMVGHIERFNPAVAKLADLIAEGRVGRVFRIHATRVGPLPTRILDAGVTIDLATHDLDIMQFALGRAITSIYAEGSQFLHPTQEDMISCLLRFGDDGPMGLLDVNWLTPEKRRELTVIGEGGMLSASYLTQDVWFTESTGSATGWDELARVRGDAEGTAVRFALRRVEPLRAELEAFAECVLEDTPEPVDAHDGCRALAAALAVRDSAANSRPIKLLDMPGERRPLRAVA